MCDLVAHLDLVFGRELDDGGAVNLPQQHSTRACGQTQLWISTRSCRSGVPAGLVCTCGADVLRSLPGGQLQGIDQCADGKSAQRVRVSLFGQNRHASDSAGRPDQVSGLHVLCGDDPALTASAGDQSDVSRSDGGEDAGEERSKRSHDHQEHH